MGYLSQIVRDARPRAAPSLYAGAPARPATPGEAQTYARLLESDTAPMPDASRVAEASETSAQAAPQSIPRPQDLRIARKEPVRDPEDQARPIHPAQRNTESAAAHAALQKPQVPHLHPAPPTAPFADKVPEPALTTTAPEGPEAAAPQTPAIRVSGQTPRPIAPKVTRYEQGAATTTPDPTPSKSAQDMTPEVTEPPRVKTARPAATPTIEPRASVRRLDRAAGPTVSADASGPQPYSVTPSPVLPDAAMTTQPQTSTGPTEVRIGEVEIVVQEPPAPRASAARPAAAPAPPSPSRHYVRRL